ncbi:fibrohexamerin-like [Battus philenor]|uniref:fibrohexamerin-like n=1 Tax=Battus philenor TaxID=42288 RepID=UPI0035CF4B06
MYIKLLILALSASLVASDIRRPCALSDYNCIGRVLAANSNCNPRVVGSVPSSYTVSKYHFHAPHFNASYIDYNLVIKNHNLCKVSEFFLNLSSNTAVLALDCPQLVFSSTRETIQHRSLQEDTRFSYNYHGTYPLIRLTTNLHASNGLNLCTSFNFADVVALPKFRINPNDRKTANYLSRDLTLLNVFERETFFWRAPLLTRYFINSLLCNFGCNY